MGQSVTMGRNSVMGRDLKSRPIRSMWGNEWGPYGYLTDSAIFRMSFGSRSPTTTIVLSPRVTWP